MSKRTIQSNKTIGKEKRSILFVSDSLGGGGAERALTHFANELVNRGHGVDIYCFHQVKAEYPRDSRIKVTYSRNQKGGVWLTKLKRYYGYAKDIRLLVKTSNYDFVIPFCPEMTVTTYLACIGLQQKIIAAIRNNPETDCGRLKKIIRDATVKRCCAIWTQNVDQAAYYRSYDLPILILGNICPRPEKRAIDRGERPIAKYVTVGRLHKQKNQVLMIEAFVEAYKKLGGGISLDIAGVGPLEDDLRGLIHSLGAQSFINLLGRVNDVDNLLYERDAFLFSSNYEGMPNALIEATLSGLPVVTTSFKTGLVDIIPDDSYGLIVEAGSTPQLRDAIIEVYTNYAQAFARSERALARMEMLTDKGLALEKLEAFFSSLLCMGGK